VIEIIVSVAINYLPVKHQTKKKCIIRRYWKTEL